MRDALELKETVDVKICSHWRTEASASRQVTVKTKDVISGATAVAFDHSICLNYNDHTARPFIRLIRSRAVANTQVDTGKLIDAVAVSSRLLHRRRRHKTTTRNNNRKIITRYRVDRDNTRRPR